MHSIIIHIPSKKAKIVNWIKIENSQKTKIQLSSIHNHIIPLITSLHNHHTCIMNTKSNKSQDVGTKRQKLITLLLPNYLFMPMHPCLIKLQKKFTHITTKFSLQFIYFHFKFKLNSNTTKLHSNFTHTYYIFT